MNTLSQSITNALACNARDFLSVGGNMYKCRSLASIRTSCSLAPSVNSSLICFRYALWAARWLFERIELVRMRTSTPRWTAHLTAPSSLIDGIRYAEIIKISYSASLSNSTICIASCTGALESAEGFSTGGLSTKRNASPPKASRTASSQSRRLASGDISSYS